MSYEGALVEVVNWEKYNPRTDAKRPNWFRIDNTLATGPGFHDLDCEQKWLWIVILSLACQKNGDKFEWKSSYIQAITGIKKNKQFETLEIFEKFVRLRVSRTTSCESRSNSHATNERTNERTNEQMPDFDFESLYRKYPRKEGKTEGIKRCKSQIKTQEDYDALALAIDNYKKRLAREGTEQKFIKHFSSFMSSWRDWIEKDVTTFHGDQPVQPVYKPPEWIKEEPCDPERVRAIVSGVFGSMPKESA